MRACACVCVRYVQLAGQSSSSTLQIKTEELSRQYKEQLNSMRHEKDQEIQRLRVSSATMVCSQGSGDGRTAQRDMQGWRCVKFHCQHSCQTGCILRFTVASDDIPAKRGLSAVPASVFSICPCE